MQNVAVNKMMSKKLEQLGHETKGNLCALQKKFQAIEMENKQLKDDLKSVSERMDRDNEINKRQLEKLTNNIHMVLKVTNNLTKEQRKIEIDNQQLNARLEQICEVIGIDSAGCSNNDTSND
jgi:predicted RNase H-like nuclease (RuvC/YqgF family)